MSDDSGESIPTNQGHVVGAGESKVYGIFSTQTVAKVGTGTTQRRTIQKTYWFVNERDDGVVEVQPLNINYVPSGPKRTVDKEELLAKFNPEPEFYVSTVYPKLKDLDDTIVRGEAHRERGANYSAEFEFKRATAVDEENVRANFGLGLTYLDRGDTVKANDIFERLVHLDAAFEEDHKHLFNDFGINLRKNKMFDQALDYYLRAEELVDNDENLYHNVARVYLEKGQMDKCLEYLKKSLDVNPGMRESQLFLAYLVNNGMVKPADLEALGMSMPDLDADTADFEDEPEPEVGDDDVGGQEADGGDDADDGEDPRRKIKPSGKPIIL